MMTSSVGCGGMGGLWGHGGVGEEGGVESCYCALGWVRRAVCVKKSPHELHFVCL